jgi:hypothetical protein
MLSKQFYHGFILVHYWFVIKVFPPMTHLDLSCNVLGGGLLGGGVLYYGVCHHPLSMTGAGGVGDGADFWWMGCMYLLVV